MSLTQSQLDQLAKIQEKNKGKNRLINISATILALLCLYQICLSPMFVPSLIFYKFGLLITLAIPSLWFIYVVAWCIKKYQKEPEKRDKLKTLKASVLIVGVVFVLSYVLIMGGFVYGFGGIVTALIGREYQNNIYVPDKSAAIEGCFRSRHINHDSYEVVSPNLERNFLKKLCVKKVNYNYLPSVGFIAVNGKQSLFGKSITATKVSDKILSPEEAKRMILEANAFWEVGAGN